MTEISSNLLIGQWTISRNRIVADEIENKIEHLISTTLVKMKISSDGWTTLYQNPLDASYWMLSYPSSEIHGGGPRRLEKVNLKEVEEFFY